VVDEVETLIGMTFSSYFYGSEMKIAILGTRGIPNRYGGFEQFAEIVSQAWLAEGHDVWVYCGHRHEFKGHEFKGVHRISIFDPEYLIGTAGQFLYDLGCILDARKRNFDVILQLGYTSSSVWWPLLPKKPAIITNMDGLEWKRSKYSPMVRRFLRHAEAWAVKSSDLLISDSPGIRQYLLEHYQKDSEFIAYGADIPEISDNHLHLSTFGVEPFGYNLLIARFEPENNLEMILEGIEKSAFPRKTLVVGNPGNAFGKYLKNRFRHSSILFTGAIYNKECIDELRKFAFLYYHGHSVGGTNPSLLEAMATGARIAAHDNIFNRAVLEDLAEYFSNSGDVARQQLSQPPGNREQAAEKMKQRIVQEFSWKKISSQYLDCFKKLRK
jgi:glycosyltransferase involved in cell wall biosynthesis